MSEPALSTQTRNRFRAIYVIVYEFKMKYIQNLE